MKVDEKSKATASRLAGDIHLRMRNGLTPPELELLLAEVLSRVALDAAAETWEAACDLLDNAVTLEDVVAVFAARAKETST